MIEDYKAIRHEGHGRYQTIRFLVLIVKLKIELFLHRQIWKVRIRKQTKEWMRGYIDRISNL